MTSQKNVVMIGVHEIWRSDDGPPPSIDPIIDAILGNLLNITNPCICVRRADTATSRMTIMVSSGAGFLGYIVYDPFDRSIVMSTMSDGSLMWLSSLDLNDPTSFETINKNFGINSAFVV